MRNCKASDACPLPLTLCRDPIEWVKKQLVDHSLVSADHIKDIEKEIRKDVQDALKKVRLSSTSLLHSHNATWPASSLLLLFSRRCALVTPTAKGKRPRLRCPLVLVFLCVGQGRHPPSPGGPVHGHLHGRQGQDRLPALHPHARPHQVAHLRLDCWRLKWVLGGVCAAFLGRKVGWGEGSGLHQSGSVSLEPCR